MVDAPLEKEIRAKCQELADFLVEKNGSCGNSASQPIGIFAKRLDTLAQSPECNDLRERKPVVDELDQMCRDIRAKAKQKHG